jgi:hypothetical protein
VVVCADRPTWTVVAARDRVLGREGVLVLANRGDCPLGPLGERIGDQVPLFELVLLPRAARLVVPLLGGVTALGVGVVAARSRAGHVRGAHTLRS